MLAVNTSNVISGTISKQRRKLIGDTSRNPNFKMNILRERIENFIEENIKCDNEIHKNEPRSQRLPVKKKNYNTILNDAVILNKPEYIELLIKYGVPLNNRSKNQMTPLEIAIINNNYEICSMLLYHNCAQFQSRFCSHLIYAIYGGNNAEIQLLLLDYEVDVNVSFMGLSLLFTAIERSHFLIPHLLNRGADVNNEDIIDFILMNRIPVAYFKLIWDKFDYEIWKDDHHLGIIATILRSSAMPSDLWDGYLRVVIEDDRIQHILNDEYCIIWDVVRNYAERGFLESTYYDIICILLSHGSSIDFFEMHRIYNLLGSDSKLLKFLLHMDIQDPYENLFNFNFVRVYYCLQKPVNQLFKSLIYNMRIVSMKHSYLDILRYFTLPADLKEILIKRDAPEYISVNLDKYKRTVPPLLELARNEARDFICRKYNIVSSGLYYSIVKHYLLLPEVLKNILTFQCPIYQCVLSD